MGGGQRQFLVPDVLRFAYPGVGIEVGHGEKLVAGLFDRVFPPQPVEQRALGLLPVRIADSSAGVAVVNHFSVGGARDA